MIVSSLVVGLVLLTLGRKLFWLFVACIGFFAGIHFGQQFWGLRSELFILVLSLGLGVLGALIALVFQRLAVGLAGFWAGGVLGLNLLSLWGAPPAQWAWGALLVGGVLGAVVLYLLFDWGLILISSLAGASLIVQAVHLSPAMEVGVFLVLLVCGVIIQARLLKSGTRPLG
jgi:hypothetical protein